MGPEQDRLMKRLFDDPNRRLLNFKFTPGDRKSSAEEICSELNRALDEVERRRQAGDRSDDLPRTNKTPVNVREFVDKLGEKA